MVVWGVLFIYFFVFSLLCEFFIMKLNHTCLYFLKNKEKEKLVTKNFSQRRVREETQILINFNEENPIQVFFCTH